MEFVDYLNGLTDGQQFHAIIGFSQGVTMALTYLSHNVNFTRAVLFNGYLPTTHQGLKSKILEKSPFSMPALNFMGRNDFIISINF